MSTKSKLVLGLAAAVMLGALAASDAFADDNMLRINADDVRLRARPNEKAPTLLKLDDGQVVKLLERKGRWLKVQVRGKQGWIPRSYVEEDLREEDEVVAAREGVQDTRSRRSKSNRRRGDKGFDTLDEDARGEDGISESVDEEDEDEFEDEESDDRTSAKRKKTKAEDEDSEFEDEEADEEAFRKSKKMAKASIRAGSTVMLKSKTPVRMKPSKSSDPLFEASKGEEVEVIMVNEDDPEYVRIKTEDGSKGWVPRKQLALSSGGGDDEETEDEEGASEDEESEDPEDSGEAEEEDDAEAGVTKRGKGIGGYAVNVGGSVGLVSKGQTFVSPGEDPVRSNYKLGNNAPVVILGATAGKRWGKYTATADLGYVRSIGGKGISVKNADGTETEQVTWVTQQMDIGITGGYLLKGGKYQLGGRAGYHIGQVAVSGNMIAALAGERISGIRFGATFLAPKVTEKIGMRATLDTLLSGSLTQQAGLRDGQSSKVTAYYLGLGGTYDIRPQLALQGGYYMAYERFNFDGMSERVDGVSTGRRKDISHMIGFGVGYDF